MAHSVRITDVKTAYSQARSRDFVEVTVEITDEGKFVETRKFGYDLDATEDLIRGDMERLAKSLDTDKEVARKSAERDAELANARRLEEVLLKDQTKKKK